MSIGASRGFTAFATTLFVGVLVPALAIAASTTGGFVERDVTVDGTHVHLRIGGSGPPVVLLHGYAETHRAYGSRLQTHWRRASP